ncbi:MAG: putative pterin-4-alpha-carbinolamine dehydratase [Meiothermus sp.]|uniref:Putative pterin-4-alpha-carbinolamine dehydratase n=2 Tax=Meiothermus hypogaeus TaxID=884155 RepID=A0A511R489_9DEIN|nr:4a-hydroxytetrahydrobiopterin dehydratase [Meiothermus hypogaeus]RIH76546.1 putative pterin-4-alpha-carbinolamine dehydratase [Meiothermus hypogaeus]GEM84421.1 putative pterin-4-alpha-carbinolamine dehydratase [Meiothermus hypogaeus NBRC 106114]GIW37825.1 MAG: putative pterin-4-alpha-carbinolamine dehydratase [Meiothermus sp.]
MVTRLNEGEIRNGLQGLPQWALVEGRIEKTFTFDTYAEGVAFAVKVALHAEKVDHHPDSLEIMWGKVKVAYVTHSAGGVTSLDLEAAAQIDALV